MDSENYKEGQSMQRPPLFEANCFIYWKNRFETYVKSKDIDLWHIIVYDNYKPTLKNKDTGLGDLQKQERKIQVTSLKVRKVSSDEEVSCSESDDEEYAMAVRDFKKFFRRRGKFVRQPHEDKKNFWKIKEDKKEKEDRRFFRCGDPNHFISDYPKHSYNDQKTFVVGCWSDSEEESKKKEICLMTLDYNEVLFDTPYYSSSSLDSETFTK
ncbi:hypothetical protein Tco_0002046 [Tanacetum coccineum]